MMKDQIENISKEINYLKDPNWNSEIGKYNKGKEKFTRVPENQVRDSSGKNQQTWR